MARSRIKVIKSHDGKKFIPVELRFGIDLLGIGMPHKAAKVTTATPFQRRSFTNYFNSPRIAAV